MINFTANCIVTIILLFLVASEQQRRPYLDRHLLGPFTIWKGVLANLTTGQGRINTLYRTNKKLGKVQAYVSESKPFFCNVKDGPGARSEKPPNSVNKVRPGDIDVIAAIGDSLTAANGAMSDGLLDLINENRGLSWSIGGRSNWRKYLTLPNILREFNPKLYGYSADDGLTVSRTSKFNVAEPATMYEDMLYQTRILLKRMKRDPLVDMEFHWKLITIFLGCNDICSRLCELPKPLDIIEEHKNYIYTTLRYLRSNFPRTLINWVVVPNLTKLTEFKNVPLQCYMAERVECRCLYGQLATPEKLRFYDYIIQEMQKAQIDIVSKDEFHTNTFTVNWQPFTYNLTIPRLSNGNLDLHYFASDCFHFSQLGQARAANALWNNMLQPSGRKQMDWMPTFNRFDCPSHANAFIATRENSNIHQDK